MPFTNYRSQKHQYRQNERIIAKFTCNLAGANGTWLRASGSNQVSNNKVTIGAVATAFSGVTPGASCFVVAMPKTRLVTLMSALHYPAAAGATAADQRVLYPLTDVPVTSGGNFTWVFAMTTAAGVLALPVLASTLSFSWDVAT